MGEPDQDFSQDDYVEHLEKEVQEQYNCIAEAQKFGVVFVELLDFLMDNFGEDDDDPIRIESQVYQDLLEGYLEKCSDALCEFQEKFGSLISFED